MTGLKRFAKALTITSLAAILLALSIGSASAASVTLEWDYDNTTEPDVVGFRIYQSTKAGGPYTKAGEVFNKDARQMTIDEGKPVADVTYFYVATAFSNTEESGYSNEVSRFLNVLNVPGMLRVVK